MSFSLVNPSTWGVGDKLTSAQINALDADHADALDKTGDQITGTVTFGVGATLTAGVTGAIVASAANGVSSTIAGGIKSTVASGVQATAVGGVRSTVAGGIDGNIAGGVRASIAGGIDSGVSGGIKPGVAGGITSDIAGGLIPTIAGGIKTTTAGGIESAVAGGIKTTVNGGILLAASSSDWPTFSATRLITRRYPFAAKAFHYPSASLISSTGGMTLDVADVVDFEIPTHEGATLYSVVLYFHTATGRGSLPTNLPKFGVFRYDLSGTASLLSTGGGYSTYPTPGSVGAYETASIKSLFYYADQNNVIDTSTYSYSAHFTNENGGGAITGNIFEVMEVTYIVSDMRFA